MITDPIVSLYYDIRDAINECSAKGYSLSTLILLFSLIDILEYLNMPETNSKGGDKVFNDGEDFRNWVKNYMGDIAPVTPEHLWAQRNAMLHTMTYKSRDTLKNGFYIVFDEAFKAPTAKEDEDGNLCVMISRQWLIDQVFMAADKFIIKSATNPKAQERAQGLYVKSTLNDLQRKGV